VYWFHKNLIFITQKITMKHIQSSFLSFLLVVFVMVGCGESKPKQKTVNHDAHNGHAEAVTNSVQFEDISHSEVVHAYLALKDALVATDGNATQMAAQKLADVAGEGFSEIQSYAKEMAASTDTEAQRIHLESLSKAVLTMVEKSELTEGNLYVQYCPMAFDNKGASWLSASDQIRNPYFGDKMLKCGVVEKTLE